MNRKSRVYLVLFIVSVSLLTWWYAADDLSSETLSRYLSSNKPSLTTNISTSLDDDTAIQDTDVPEPPSLNSNLKITVTVVWVVRDDPAPAKYMPLFFQSVAANPTVDLLFVIIHEKDRNCVSYTNVPNVKVPLSSSGCALNSNLHVGGMLK